MAIIGLNAQNLLIRSWRSLLLCFLMVDMWKSFSWPFGGLLVYRALMPLVHLKFMNLELHQLFLLVVKIKSWAQYLCIYGLVIFSFWLVCFSVNKEHINIGTLFLVQQVALKTLIVIHRTLREGDPTFREELLNFQLRGRILQLSNFKDDSSPIGEFDALIPILKYLDCH